MIRHFKRLLKHFIGNCYGNKHVTDFIRTCIICQTTNDEKFVKQAIPIHPIPV